MGDEPRCPKCNSVLEELDVSPEEYQDMTDGQQSDHEAGFNRPFSCPKCDYYGLKDIEVYDPLPDDAYKMADDLINGGTIEELIIRAIKKRSFIEVISLMHNVIEELLVMKIEDFILNKYDSDYKTLISDRENIERKNPELAKKLEILNSGEKQKYLNNFKEYAFFLGLIDKNMFDMITKFNTLRNSVIHNLIRSKKNKSVRYRQVMETAKLGRRIYYKLSIIKHSEEHIEKLLKEFKVSSDEGYDDPFLNFVPENIDSEDS